MLTEFITSNPVSRLSFAVTRTLVRRRAATEKACSNQKFLAPSDCRRMLG